MGEVTKEILPGEIVECKMKMQLSTDLQPSGEVEERLHCSHTLNIFLDIPSKFDQSRCLEPFTEPKR